MVDYELFKSILTRGDDGYIEAGDFIDYRTMLLFAESPVTKLKSLFKRSSGDVSNPCQYSIELTCPECQKKYKRFVSFSRLYDTVRVMSGSKAYEKRVDLHCDDCKAILLQKQKELDKKALEEYEKRLKERTDKYIENYLDPIKTWKKGVPFSKKWDEITQNGVDRQAIAEYIKNMDYHEFLQTPYWKTIADKKKYHDKYKCAVCNSSENINVHHRTYEHHGEELRYMWKDLICLCHECHEKFHFD